MNVELDLFSGRPNPRWPLNDDDVARLAELIDSLDPAHDRMPTTPGLGYRGFRFDDAWAYRGFVQSRRGVLADPERRVEKFLAETLPAEYRDLQSAIEWS